MRIGLIVPGFSADQDDWGIPALRDLVRELAILHEVHVFALRYPHRRGSYRVDGATVTAFGGAFARRAGRASLLARAVAGVARQHRRRPFDVLHGFWADEPGLVAVTTAPRLRIPALVSVMGGELVGLRDIAYGGQLGLVGRTLTRHVLRRAAAVTVGSAYLRGLVEKYPCGGRVVELPLGVDLRRFHADPPTDDGQPLVQGDLRLLHVASLVPVKDQDTLLRALARVAGRVPGVHLHMVGDGPMRGRLEDLARALQIDRHVTFHGAVAHDRLRAFYRGADLCVLSSRHESQGMVVLEAAACARATVGTDVGILPELALPHHVVPTGDAPGLADALASLLREPAALADLGERALERVSNGLGLDQTIGDLCGLYGAMVDR
jgi:glycosyltransferase involved in cell wall biosynthesis